ncbi:MAG: AraC family transcriptional regulator [Lentisphaeria bacterium]
MRLFVNTTPHPWPQRLLAIDQAGTPYRLHLCHATLEEVSQTGVRRPTEPHSHGDLYHLVLYVRGSNRAQMPSGMVAVQPGSLLLTSPGDAHSFGVIDPGSVAYHEVTFRFLAGNGHPLSQPFPSWLGSLCGMELPAWQPVLQLDDLAVADLKTRLAGLFEILQDVDAGTGFRAAGQLAGILAAVVTQINCRRSAPDARSAVARGLKRVLDFQSIHFAGVLSARDLAAKAGLSRATFLRHFKQVTGTSPKARQTALRLAAGKQLLCATDLTLDEIASRLGFCDAYHFGRAFKQLTGLSPGAFRRTGTELLAVSDAASAPCRHRPRPK